MLGACRSLYFALWWQYADAAAARRNELPFGRDYLMAAAIQFGVAVAIISISYTLHKFSSAAR